VTLKRTPSWLTLAADIDAGMIRYYPWKRPRAWHAATDREVTAALGKFLDADPPLAATAARPDDPDREPWPVHLTDAGRAWLADRKEP
jgi:hypothetical protein